MALSALNSCQKPTPALMNSIARMIARSAQCRSSPRQQGRGLDHPGDRPPEEMGETLENANMVLRKRILAILGKPPRGLRFAQARRLV